MWRGRRFILIIYHLGVYWCRGRLGKDGMGRETPREVFALQHLHGRSLKNRLHLGDIRGFCLPGITHHLLYTPCVMCCVFQLIELLFVALWSMMLNCCRGRSDFGFPLILFSLHPLPLVYFPSTLPTDHNLPTTNDKLHQLQGMNASLHLSPGSRIHPRVHPSLTPLWHRKGTD